MSLKAQRHSLLYGLASGVESFHLVHFVMQNIFCFSLKSELNISTSLFVCVQLRRGFICVHVVFDVSRLVLYDRLIYFLFTYIIVEKPSDLKVLFIMTFSSQVTSATFFIKIIYT